MAKGGLAPPQGAELGKLVRANVARDQLRELDEGGTARVALSGVVRHRPPPGPAKARVVPKRQGRQAIGYGEWGLHARLERRTKDVI